MEKRVKRLFSRVSTGRKPSTPDAVARTPAGSPVIAPPSPSATSTSTSNVVHFDAVQDAIPAACVNPVAVQSHAVPSQGLVGGTPASGSSTDAQVSPTSPRLPSLNGSLLYFLRSFLM
jgi:hypothetical protein